MLYAGKVVLQITKHYSKPGVTPVEVLPVLPDFEVNSENICVLLYHYHQQYSRFSSLHDTAHIFLSVRVFFLFYELVNVDLDFIIITSCGEIPALKSYLTLTRRSLERRHRSR